MDSNMAGTKVNEVIANFENKDIDVLRDILVEIVNPDKIILFGSYAYGVPSENSDVDFIVIKEGKDYTIDDEAELAAQVFFKRKELGLKTRCDIFLENEKNFIAAATAKNCAYSDALTKGVTVYVREYRQ